MNLGSLFGGSRGLSSLWGAAQNATQYPSFNSAQPLGAYYQGLSGYNNTELPTFNDPRFESYEEYAPLQQLADIEAIQSKYGDPQGEAELAQLDQLRTYQDLAKTGTTAQSELDRANFLAEQGARDRGAREAILDREQSMTGGNASGRRLSAMLGNAQNSANLANQLEMQRAADIENTRLGAMAGVSSLGGNITAQDFARKSALDSISKYNDLNKRDWAVRNNSLANESATRNTDIRNVNRDRADQAVDYKNKYSQQQFANRAYNNQGMNQYNNQLANFLQNNANFNAGNYQNYQNNIQDWQRQDFQTAMNGLSQGGQGYAAAGGRGGKPKPSGANTIFG